MENNTTHSVNPIPVVFGASFRREIDTDPGERRLLVLLRVGLLLDGLLDVLLRQRCDERCDRALQLQHLRARTRLSAE